MYILNRAWKISPGISRLGIFSFVFSGLFPHCQHTRNHDYRGSVNAQIEYTTYQSCDPRWQLPARYYSVKMSPDNVTTLMLGMR